MRKVLAQNKKVKITINFDSDVLKEVKDMAEDMGTPYQTLLNKIVRDAVKTKVSDKARLDRLEKEIKKLKKLLPA